MKALIFTVTAGEGHNAVAKAVMESLAEKGHEVKLVDALKENHPRYAKIVNDGYFFGNRYFLRIMNFIYRWMQKRPVAKKEKCIVRKVNNKDIGYVEAKIKEFAPDVIFCTHLFPAAMMEVLKRENKLPCKAVAMLTDYRCHPYWQAASEIDYMINPSDDSTAELIAKGFNKDTIVTTGIPTKHKFTLEADKAETRKELGIDTGKFTVMMMNGGQGLGNITKKLKKLDAVERDFQIISVCGKNAKHKQKIDSLISRGKLKHKVLNIGFATNVDVLMSASDCLFGKAGAISINEALNKRLPLITSGKLPAQEMDNIVFLTSHGAAIYVKKRPDKALLDLYDDADRLAMLRHNIEKIRTPDALERITGLLINVSDS